MKSPLHLLPVLIAAFFIQCQPKPSCNSNPQLCDSLKSWVYTLAADSMMGRANGSPEMQKAANFIELRFKQAGLKPFFGDSTFIQEYTYGKSQIKERNVVGILSGTQQPVKEYIVLSAHFDHIGIERGAEDSIFNGADDNASGTALLMALAYELSKNYKSERSIIFAAFSGEEHGFRGSGHFCRNLPFEASNIVLNLNFDMVGRTDDLKPYRFYITGDSLSNLRKRINDFNKTQHWRVVSIPTQSFFYYVMSDNISFARTKINDTLGIVAHTLATGITNRSYLHKPNDDAEFINYDHLTEFATYMAGLVRHFGKTEVTFESYHRFKPLVAIFNPLKHQSFHRFPHVENNLPDGR
jgi:hypothetical protein